LSHHAAMGGGAFPNGVNPPGLDIYHVIDHPGT
jgi:hypothetical protein